MKEVNYIELEQCDGCPYRETEVLEKRLYANDSLIIVSTELRCKNYFICERIIYKTK